MKTESISYLGSKQKTLSLIHETLKQYPISTVFDAFSGSTRVSQSLSYHYSVISNDLSEWSNVLATCYLLNEKPKEYYQEIITHLNQLKPKHGWFTEHYGNLNPKDKNRKYPLQLHNSQKLDAIREEIDHLNLPFFEKCVLLTSLMLAIDQVSNTMGHFVSYLSDWSKKSYKNIYLQVPSLIYSNYQHQVYQEDIFKLLYLKADCTYLDPPYGSNHPMPSSRVRYQSYYHFWTTLIRNDQPLLFGKANRRFDTKDQFSISIFEDCKEEVVKEALETLIKNIKSKYVLLSYSSSGRLSSEQLLEMINNTGELVQFIVYDYKKNVMSSITKLGEWKNQSLSKHQEYLFMIQKT